MPGVFCNGVDTDQPLVNVSHAYCEGFYARALSNAASNIYNQTETPTDYAEYQRGLDNAAALAGQTLTRANCGCCAGEGLTVPV